MKVMDFRSFKDLPKRVVVAYIVSAFFALSGLVLIILDMTEVASIPLKFGMGLIVISQIISLFNVWKYRNRMYK